MNRFMVNLEQPGGFGFVTHGLLQNLDEYLPLYGGDALLENFLEGQILPGAHT